jgi:hypothetical protein
MVLGMVVDFWGLIFPARWSDVFAGGFAENGVQNVVFFR